MSASPRIGVFGGTFDPIHKAHIDLARAARDQAHLDKVLFVVAGNPPHKRYEVVLDAEERYLLVEAALAEEPGLEPCRVELDRPGYSYTADTLDALAVLFPGAKLFLILGMDAVNDLPQWHEPERILKRVTLLVARRPETEVELPLLLRGDIQVLDFDERPVSSTTIRTRIARGDSVDDLLPPPVLALIEKKGWYGHDRIRTRA